jgi:hypothetical protein
LAASGFVSLAPPALIIQAIAPAADMTALVVQPDAA